MGIQSIIKAAKKGFGEGFRESGELSTSEVVVGAVGFIGTGYAVMKFGHSALNFVRKIGAYRDAVSKEKDNDTASLNL